MGLVRLLKITDLSFLIITFCIKMKKEEQKSKKSGYIMAGRLSGITWTRFFLVGMGFVV